MHGVEGVTAGYGVDMGWLRFSYRVVRVVNKGSLWGGSVVVMGWFQIGINYSVQRAKKLVRGATN